MKISNLIFATVCGFVLAACGSSLDGTYATEGNGMMQASYTFKSGGKGVSRMMSMEQEFEYKREGDEVKISSPSAPQMALIMKVVDENTLSGPMGMVLKKTK